MNKDRQHIERDIEHVTVLTMNTIKIIYLNLEIVWHTALSDAQFLKLNTLASRNLLLHSPHADILVRAFGEGTEYFKKSSIKSKL